MLPALSIAIEGLSGWQVRSISRDYGAFVLSDTALERDVVDVVCHAARHPDPSLLPPRTSLGRNGQYAPLTITSTLGLEIIGFNFAAIVAANGTGPSVASLQVPEEADLPNLTVIDNFLRILVARRVLAKGGVLLHSAGVLHQGSAYLFTGRSNAGKTTLARKATVTGARVLSDDINLVLPEDGRYTAQKVPFTGEFGRRAENVYGPGSVPLGGIVLLDKAPELNTAPVRYSESVAGLMTGCPFVNTEPDAVPKLMDVLTDLAAKVPIVRAGVAIDDSFDAVIHKVLEQLQDA